jgi:NTP pyrophosphatase (non-canonical NTP hydrolase)
VAVLQAISILEEVMKARCVCGFDFYAEFSRGICPKCKRPIMFISNGMVMTNLELEIKRFADQQWPGRDVADRIRKLGEEFGELAEALLRGDQEAAFLEAGDCGIVLTDLLALLGKSLTVAMMVKLDINVGRISDAND